MSRERLASASETLRTASENVTNSIARERLTEQADQLATLAERDRAPDHGRLARHEHALENVKSLLGPGQTGAIDEALNDIRTYRETIDGV